MWDGYKLQLGGLQGVDTMRPVIYLILSGVLMSGSLNAKHWELRSI
jgi:hypothetical protein